MYFVFPSSILGIRIRRICLYFFPLSEYGITAGSFQVFMDPNEATKIFEKKININLFHMYVVILFFIFNILFLYIFKKSEFVTINYVKKEILSVMKCTSIITLFTIDSFPLNLLQYYIGKHLLPNIYKGLLLYIYIYIYKWYHCIGWWGARQLLGDGVGWGLVETVEIHLYRGATALEYHIWMFIFLFLKYLLI